VVERCQHVLLAEVHTTPFRAILPQPEV